MRKADIFFPRRYLGITLPFLKQFHILILFALQNLLRSFLLSLFLQPKKIYIEGIFHQQNLEIFHCSESFDPVVHCIYKYQILS